MGELIAIVSGKGGTGKTSVCAGIATALAAANCSVLCIDCDVGLRNLDISLGLAEMPALSFLEVCQGSYSLDQATAHPLFPSLHFLTAPMNTSAGAIDEAAFGAFIYDARRDYDFILLDAPAGLEAGFRLTTLYADRCILVTGPSPAAIRDAQRTGQLLELMGKRNVRLVVNRVDRKIASAMDLTVDDVMDTAGLPLLAVVPEDMNVTLAATFGTPVLKFKPRSAVSKAFRRIAKRIQGIPEPINLR